MKKTVFTQSQMVGLEEDLGKIRRDLQSVRDVLACIAFQQSDQCLEVPFSALQAMPTGLTLEVVVDQARQAYLFKVILPAAPTP